uniref:serine/arginine repetitive matrix protein 1-like n=1 Tax=Bombus vancouverensis nearcticus TaxID=2705178 RepID=UPI00143CB304
MKKSIKRKIIIHKTAREFNSILRLPAQKTRKLNPQPNLVARAKSLANTPRNTAVDHHPSQEEKANETKNMKPTRATSPPAIVTKNRFSILQSEPEPHPQPGPSNSTWKSTLEQIKKKNETLRGKTGRHGPTTSPEQSAQQGRRTPPYNPGGPAPPTPPRGDRAPDGRPTGCSAEERTSTPPTTKDNRPPPINILLQDPKDTVMLIEKIADIKQFHIKRIHSAREFNSILRLPAQKTRKLNPQPNLVARAKSLASTPRNTAVDHHPSQEEKANETKNMKPTRATSPPAIVTKNRFSILQSEPEPHPQPGPSNSTWKSTLEQIKKKNETLRGKTGRHGPTTSPEQSAQQGRRTPPYNPGGPAPPTPPRGDRAPDGRPTGCSAEERTSTPPTTKDNRPPPINILLQDPKDTVMLIEKIADIKQFHIKRIHSAREFNSILRLPAQKTRKLNPQPNLVARAKSLASTPRNTAVDHHPSQEEKANETKNMKPTRATSPPAIVTKNRFSILQSEPEPHPQPGPSNSTWKSTLEQIKKKNETLRGKTGRHGPTTSPEQSAQQGRRTPPYNPGGPAPPTSPRGDRAPDGRPTGCSAEERTSTPPTTKDNRPPPINILLQDPKDTVMLIEKIADIKQFHIKRIHS